MPICKTSLPSCVNLTSWSSPTCFKPGSARPAQLLPPTQTKPLWSMWMPCSRCGHSKPAPSPPHALMKLPALSNTRIAGAFIAACSGLSVRGRCSTQILSCASIPMLEGSPSRHCGGTFGQERSSSNTGMERVCALTCATCVPATTINAARAARHAGLRIIVASRCSCLLAQRFARTEAARRGGAVGFRAILMPSHESQARHKRRHVPSGGMP